MPPLLQIFSVAITGGVIAIALWLAVREDKKR